MAAKKVVKKAAAKKAPAAKKPKSSAKKMATVSGSLCFWVNNGPILSNIKDLHRALMHMNEQQFMYHVNKEKNDFAKWVKLVLKEEDLSKALMGSKSKDDALKAVSMIVAKYN